jgi:hypothetical protein
VWLTFKTKLARGVPKSLELDSWQHPGDKGRIELNLHFFDSGRCDIQRVPVTPSTNITTTTTSL